MLPLPIAALFALASLPTPVEVAGVKLIVSAAPEKPSFLFGEPGYVDFTIRNISARDSHIWFGGDYQNRFGRPDTFIVDVIDAKGDPLQHLDPGWHFGGISSVVTIPAGGKLAVLERAAKSKSPAALRVAHSMIDDSDPNVRAEARKLLSERPDDAP